eukprot:SAG11_NODE_170_length_13624_cov_40.078226_13_plen_109_part_00
MTKTMRPRPHLMMTATILVGRSPLRTSQGVLPAGLGQWCKPATKPPGALRRASAPVSSLQDEAGFSLMLESLEGPTGWRSLFKDGNPFAGAFATEEDQSKNRKRQRLV